MVAAFVGEISSDPITLRKSLVDGCEGGWKLIEVADLEPMDGIPEEKRPIELGAIDRTALEENGARFIGD